MSSRIALLSLLSIAGSLFLGCAAPAGAEDEGATSQGAAAVESAPVVTFAADWSESVAGTLRVGKADVFFAPSRLPTCRGDQAGTPQWSITGHYRIDGGAVQTFAIAGLMAPSTNRVTLDLPKTGELELWFSNTNRWGCATWDSDFGKNYRFRIEPRADAPGWMGNAASVISRLTCDGRACDSSRRDLGEGFVFDTWARQRALVAGAYFDVWKQGVTDWDNPDLWKQLDARVYYRAAGNTEWSWTYVGFEKRVGNDARYVIPLRTIDPLRGNTRTSKADCPASLTVTPDGYYVQTEVELYFVVNGVELRPASGAYRGTFVDYKGLYDICF